MAHPVICYYCGKKFDRDKEAYYEVPGLSRRYAHKGCSATSGISKERKEEIELDEYVMKLFKMDYVHPNIKNQIKEYTTQKGFTLTGIKRTLFYYFDILNNKPSLSNPTIGIVPYVYPQAKEYYYKLYLANELNKNKKIEDYKPEEVTVTIRAPERQPLRKRELFTFLDEEVENDL